MKPRHGVSAGTELRSFGGASDDAAGRLLIRGLALKLLGHILHASYSCHRFCRQELKRRATQVVRQAFRRSDELVDALPYPAGGDPDKLVDYVVVAHSAPTLTPTPATSPAANSRNSSN